MGANSSQQNDDQFHKSWQKIDIDFLKQPIYKAEIAFRPVFKMFDHSDSIFYCSDKENVLIVSFHDIEENGERVTYVRQTVDYVQNLKNTEKYKSSRETWTQIDENPQIFFSDIVFLCEQIAKTTYKQMSNNCNHSAEDLEKFLNIFLETIKRERQFSLNRMNGGKIE